MCNSIISTRKCATCTSVLIGRKDKVFCSLECKNEHHRLARIQSKTIRTYRNRILRRNYVVLQGLNSCIGNKIKVHRTFLFKLGFDIQTYLKKKSSKVFRILEFKISILNNGIVEIEKIGNKTDYFIQFSRRWKRVFDSAVVRKINGINIFTITNTSLDLTDRPFNDS